MVVENSTDDFTDSVDVLYFDTASTLDYDNVDLESEEMVWKNVNIDFKSNCFCASENTDDQDKLLFSYPINSIKSLKVQMPCKRPEYFKSRAFISVKVDESLIVLNVYLSEVHIWFSLFHATVHIEKSTQEQRSFESFSNLFSSLRGLYDYELSTVPSKSPPAAVPNEPTALELLASTVVTPAMNIVILVVGTRGDVQPFVYFGQELQRRGHRVRLATHEDYRDDVVVKGGLEYYPLAGDPRKLSEYMVKTEGRLMPDLLNSEERKALPEKMAMLHDICYSCYPACTQPDPNDEAQRPFLADAIISNPISYGHFHVAEAICVPLHIMFPQPWSPTKSFPHPLSTTNFENPWSNSNYMSYLLIDQFMWLGLGSMFNRFRKELLGLPVIRMGERGRSLLNDNKVPISHMWSPSFVPQCPDWPPYVDVVGEFRPKKGGGGSGGDGAYVAAPQVLAFLKEAEEKGEGPPLYVGFGSMVMEEKDAANLVSCVLRAADDLGCRVLLQSGWTKYAEDYALLSERVIVVGAMPHDWLFDQVLY